MNDTGKPIDVTSHIDPDKVDELSAAEKQSRVTGDGGRADDIAAAIRKQEAEAAKVTGNEAEAPPIRQVSETENPGLAVLLTEIQETKARLDRIGVQVQAINLLAGVVVIAGLYYVFKNVEVPSG